MKSLTLFNKVYTVAFRLTGLEASASALALVALTVTARECGWQPLFFAMVGYSPARGSATGRQPLPVSWNPAWQ